MVWEPEPLPFIRNSLLESPLPSKKEIRACTNILFDRLYKVVAMNGGIVVKFGRGVKAYEGQVLIFLKHHGPIIPAPRLYAMYKDTETLVTFLVMKPNFVAGMVANYRAHIEQNRQPDCKVCYYKEYLLSLLKGHQLMLTHKDVQLKNIMFFVVSSPIVFMYWDSDSCLRIQQFLEVRPAEQAVIRIVDRDAGL
ncbi:hypothetical protein BO99DRAFT_462986 [Aspergillus violaceofuscus CBS 115571]|uniref:Protein kinase domain-containing protein n=1 Tax=Aspergillus violaceofuscus (strain CBS 115571) TaxID=1450538 RepID=A0A2V5I055_ASPV1|nr:hypothetical protein BO99DRAFT_462986 [Aspergillus violaceofuscus CBS 115571]